MYVEPHKLPSYWTEARQIYGRCRFFIAAFNAHVIIAIFPHTFKCYRDMKVGMQVQKFTNVSRHMPGYWTKVHLIFLQDVEASCPLLTRTFSHIHCGTATQRMKAVSISVRFFVSMQSNWLPWQRPLGNRKTNVRLMISTNEPIYSHDWSNATSRSLRRRV